MGQMWGKETSNRNNAAEPCLHFIKSVYLPTIPKRDANNNNNNKRKTVKRGGTRSERRLPDDSGEIYLQAVRLAPHSHHTMNVEQHEARDGELIMYDQKVGLPLSCKMLPHYTRRSFKGGEPTYSYMVSPRILFSMSIPLHGALLQRSLSSAVIITPRSEGRGGCRGRRTESKEDLWGREEVRFHSQRYLWEMDCLRKDMLKCVGLING